MVTMSDIASRAGVSRSTVSVVLNNKDAAVGIAEETRRRVLNAARQLGYRPNEVARAMVTGKSHVVAFLVADPSREVVARILAGAMNEAEPQGYFVKLVARDGAWDERIIERCVETRPVGVMGLYVPPSLNECLREEMGRYRIPVAILDSSFPQPGLTRVLSDDLEGVHQAIAHLHGLGHRRIAHIGGTRASGASTLREEGYRRAMARFGLPVPEGYVQWGEWEIDAAGRATERLLDHPEPPTAVFCADDKTALIASRAASRRGVRVPEDLSVVGFADLEMARYGNPALTTVAQPFADLGAAAVRSLLEAARSLQRGEEPDTAEVLLPNRLVVRESTARAPLSER
ncbi:MAG TPA: LacI family DNA-binding transcriptional regulator [Armatimonadaceae bacterium]|nr:LacI family DNA-binding transcriptional regulator [Armatimonadaceae bacterium]